MPKRKPRPAERPCDGCDAGADAADVGEIPTVALWSRREKRFALCRKCLARGLALLDDTEVPK